MNHSNDVQAIEAHYRRHFGAILEKARWTKGPVGDLPEDFRILIMRRGPGMLVYATQQMSLPDDNNRLELHLFSRELDRASSNEIVELLTAIAHYHRTGASLGPGHTVNFGRPWITGSSCHYGLISVPYLDGPALEWLHELDIRFLWMIPITEMELHFKKQFGLDALEQIFEEQQFDFMNPFRKSLV